MIPLGAFLYCRRLHRQFWFHSRGLRAASTLMDSFVTLPYAAAPTHSAGVSYPRRFVLLFIRTYHIFPQSQPVRRIFCLLPPKTGTCSRLLPDVRTDPFLNSSYQLIRQIWFWFNRCNYCTQIYLYVFGTCSLSVLCAFTRKISWWKCQNQYFALWYLHACIHTYGPPTYMSAMFLHFPQPSARYILQKICSHQEMGIQSAPMVVKFQNPCGSLWLISWQPSPQLLQ